MTRKRRKHEQKTPASRAAAPSTTPAPIFPAEPAKVQIDGSMHEGGGQMVRTALGLACATGISVHVSNVRAGRATPGLRQQHVTGAVLTGLASGGTVHGARVGSLAIRYDPPITAVAHTDALNAPLGSAGAASLVLQAALPALAVHASGREVALAGGTHVPSSPTAEYVTHVLCTVAKRFNVAMRYDVLRKGFFPRGGGSVVASVAVLENGVTAWRQRCRAEVVGVRGWVVSAREGFVQSGAADRMRKAARRALRIGLGERFEGCGEEEFDVQAVDVDRNANPGASLSITLVADTADGGAIGSSLTLDARAARELRLDGARSGGSVEQAAESVGRMVADELVEDVKSGACVDRHMADQIAVFMAMANEESSVTVPVTSLHMKSVKEVLDRFDIGLSFEEITDGEGKGLVRVLCPGRRGMQ